MEMTQSASRRKTSKHTLELKVNFMKKLGISYKNPDTFLYLRVQIGSDLRELLIEYPKVPFFHIRRIKDIIIDAYFCTCCINDIFLSDTTIRDGKLFQIVGVQDCDGNWQNRLCQLGFSRYSIEEEIITTSVEISNEKCLP